jgi:rubredoxin
MSKRHLVDSLHICGACGYEYQQHATGAGSFHDLDDAWQCPTCGIGKPMFHDYSCRDMVEELLRIFLKRRFNNARGTVNSPIRTTHGDEPSTMSP